MRNNQNSHNDMYYSVVEIVDKALTDIVLKYSLALCFVTITHSSKSSYMYKNSLGVVLIYIYISISTKRMYKYFKIKR